MTKGRSLMDMRRYGLTILRELETVLEQTDPAAGDILAEAILGAERIFLAGAGQIGRAHV